MGTLGLNPAQQGSEIRVDPRSRFLDRALHLVGQLIPGAALAVVLGGFTLLKQQPKEGFDLLRAWGAWWVVVLVIGYWVWSLGMLGVERIGRVADGMNALASAVQQQANKDDRERDRMITETAYVSQKVQELGATLNETREQNEEILKLLKARREG